MITLILNYLIENSTFSSTLCSGIILPLIYFTNPLPSTITQELNQLANSSLVVHQSLRQNELLTYLSKGITAYEDWLEKEENLANQESLIQLLDDLEQFNYYPKGYKIYSDSLLNQESISSDLFNKIPSYKRNRGFAKKRRIVFQAKHRLSRLSLFGQGRGRGRN